MTELIMEFEYSQYLPIHGPQYVQDGPHADLLALVDVDAVRVDLLGEDSDLCSFHE